MCLAQPTTTTAHGWEYNDEADEASTTAHAAAKILSYIHTDRQADKQASVVQNNDPEWMQDGMPVALAQALRCNDTLEPNDTLNEFMKQPVKEELGLVQFRLVGDHAEDNLWLVFDYYREGEEPCLDHRVLSCQRIHRRRLFERRRHYELRSPAGDHMGDVQCTEAGMPLLLYGGNPIIGTRRKFLVDTAGGGHSEVCISQGRGPKMFRVRMKDSVDAIEPFDEEGIEEAEETSQLHGESPCLELVSKQPTWNDRVGAYVLNFNGRVTLASSKNLILLSPHDMVQPCAEDGSQLDGGDEGRGVALRFGRVAARSQNRGLPQFTLDVGYPMSPLQAVGIAMSSLAAR